MDSGSENLRDPFAPRTSLGRSPPQALAPPPVSIESRARLPPSKKDTQDRTSDPSAPSGAPKDFKRKKRSPDGEKHQERQKVQKRDTGKQLRMRIPSSSDEESDSDSSSLSERGMEKNPVNKDSPKKQALDEAIHDLDAYISELSKRKNSMTNVAAQRLKESVRKIQDGVLELKVAMPRLEVNTSSLFE